MQVVIPVPFGEIRIGVSAVKRPRPMVWYGLLSAILHFLGLWLVTAFLVRTFVPLAQPQQKPIMVSNSSALRMEPRTAPVPAHHAIERPRPVVRPQRPQPVVRREARPAPRPAAHRPELAKPAHVAYAQPKPQTQPQPQSQALTQSAIDAQTREFQRTIEQARMASNPVAGAASSAVKPAAPRRMSLNLEGDQGKPRPEGVLYPLKRWTDGPYVYYYVRYDAQYADGSTESGEVPWPIRFPIEEDPFARGLHRMPLPGPLSDYVLPNDVAMQPLVKNCWDHRYRYCPIEHE